MLIRFTVENFLSFKDRVSFSMLPGKGGRDKMNHVIQKQKRDDISVLKTAVIFGANASGKSNIIKAVDFGRKLVLNGNAEQLLNFQSFRLNKDWCDKNSRMEFEIKHKGKNYAYGFVFSRKAIIEEWLYEINAKKDMCIFERKNIDEFDLSSLNKLNNSKEQQFIEFISKGTPNNRLFLTEIKDRRVKENVNNINDILNIVDWFQNALTIIYPNSKNQGIEFEIQENADLHNIFETMLKYFDTGINGISLQEIDFHKMDIPLKIRNKIKADLLEKNSEKTKGFINNFEQNISYIFSKKDDRVSVHKLMTKHKVEGVDQDDLFDLNEESDGTRRILDLIPMMMDLFKGGNVFMVDEMERSLHPNLIYDIIDLFIDKAAEVESQLIIASHESSLLTQKLLRKDEIWFVIKDQFGASDLYSLEEFNIRFDKEIRKDYLIGRYKAVPRFGSRIKLDFKSKQNA